MRLFIKQYFCEEHGRPSLKQAPLCPSVALVASLVALWHHVRCPCRSTTILPDQGSGTVDCPTAAMEVSLRPDVEAASPKPSYLEPRRSLALSVGKCQPLTAEERVSLALRATACGPPPLTSVSQFGKGARKIVREQERGAFDPFWFTLDEAVHWPGQAISEDDDTSAAAPQRVPVMQKYRNNLTALSQKYNVSQRALQTFDPEQGTIPDALGSCRFTSSPTRAASSSIGLETLSNRPCLPGLICTSSQSRVSWAGLLVLRSIDTAPTRSTISLPASSDRPRLWWPATTTAMLSPIT